MCGIYGWRFPDDTDITPEQRIILAAALGVQNDRRGGDSHGYYGVDAGGHVQIYRALGRAQNTAAVYAAPMVALMGHTRKATHGGVKVECAHPFTVGKIVGAHNGIIFNHTALNREYGRDFPVDSMHLFAHLNEGRSFRELSGYGAIEWIEKDEAKQVHLCRMSGGELAIFGVGTCPEDVRGVLWSSDKDHLVTACGFAGLKVFPYSVAEGRIYYVDKDGALYYPPRPDLDLAPTRTVYDARRTGSSYASGGGAWESLGRAHGYTVRKKKRSKKSAGPAETAETTADDDTPAGKTVLDLSRTEHPEIQDDLAGGRDLADLGEAIELFWEMEDLLAERESVGTLDKIDTERLAALQAWYDALSADEENEILQGALAVTGADDAPTEEEEEEEGEIGAAFGATDAADDGVVYDKATGTHKRVDWCIRDRIPTEDPSEQLVLAAPPPGIVGDEPSDDPAVVNAASVAQINAERTQGG